MPSVYDELMDAIEERKTLGLRVPTFDPHSVEEPVAERWLKSLKSDTARDLLVRRLVVEQHK